MGLSGVCRMGAPPCHLLPLTFQKEKFDVLVVFFIWILLWVNPYCCSCKLWTLPTIPLLICTLLLGGVGLLCQRQGWGEVTGLRNCLGVWQYRNINSATKGLPDIAQRDIYLGTAPQMTQSKRTSQSWIYLWTSSFEHDPWAFSYEVCNELLLTLDTLSYWNDFFVLLISYCLYGFVVICSVDFLSACNFSLFSIRLYFILCPSYVLACL